MRDRQPFHRFALAIAACILAASFFVFASESRVLALTSSCTDHAVARPEAARGIAFIGSVTSVRRARSSIDADYAVNLYTFRVQRGLARTTTGGTVQVETSWHCPGVTFPRRGLLLVSTNSRISALSWNTVAWRVLDSSDVKLVLPNSTAGVAPEILAARTLENAIDVVAPSLPPTDASMAASPPSREPFPPLVLVGALAVWGWLTLRLRSRRLTQTPPR